jgi:hypothetical protein
MNRGIKPSCAAVKIPSWGTRCAQTIPEWETSLQHGCAVSRAHIHDDFARIDETHHLAGDLGRLDSSSAARQPERRFQMLVALGEDHGSSGDLHPGFGADFWCHVLPQLGVDARLVGNGESSPNNSTSAIAAERMPRALSGRAEHP